VRLSSCSLAAAGVASRSASEPWFRQLHITASGEAVASNGRALLVVEPVDPERAARLPAPSGAPEAEPPGEGVGVPLDVATAAASAIPKEDKPSLKYALMTRCDPAGVELLTTDGARARRFSGPPARGGFPGWRDEVRAATAGGEAKRRVLVDRRALSALLAALERACPDKANRNPVFVEVGGSGAPLVLRSLNTSTGQHAVGIIKPLSAGGKWLRRSGWEARLAGEGEPGEPLAEEGRGVRRVRRVGQRPGGTA
jgi:hypothetical protein